MLLFIYTDGIVNLMASKAGPSSKELTSVAEVEKFLLKKDYVVVGEYSDQCVKDV